MRLKKLFAATMIVWISGCVCTAVKPTLEICVNDVPAGECICGMTDAAALTGITYDKIVASRTDVVRRPIAYCDKAVALRPTEWEKAENYRRQLEICLEERCP